MTTQPKHSAILLGADHAGVELKNTLKARLEQDGWRVLDAGAHSADSVDYPDYAHTLAEALREGAAAWGVLVCGSGIGMSIAANRHPHIRAALVRSPQEATLARQHNDANVMVLGARITPEPQALECLERFLTTDFEGGRHQSRVEKLNPPRC